jgi:hypothetical protein
MSCAAQSSESALATAVSVRDATSVAAGSDTLRAKDVVEVCAPIFAGVNPVADSLKHGSVSLIVHISNYGMVENAYAILQNLVLGDVDVLPGIQDARSNVLQNDRSDLSGGLVQDVGKVVL